MVHPVDSFVGQKLRNRRWMMGLTQQQLASLVGVRFQQIQKYESGVNRVSASRLWDLSQALDVSVAYFFDGYGDGPPASGNAGTDTPSPSIMDQRETIELVRAYYGIDDEARRCLLELMKTLTFENDNDEP